MESFGGVWMLLGTVLAAALPVRPISPEPADPPQVEVKVTQKHLVPVCVNGEPVDADERRWRLAPGSHSLAFTMRNAPHQDAPGAEEDPGVAVVRFTLEAGHKYEVEIRAPAMQFASRAWKRGEWKPVVRDRSQDRIVSNEPEWPVSGCDPGISEGT